jgi:hypothetical protein
MWLHAAQTKPMYYSPNILCMFSDQNYGDCGIYRLIVLPNDRYNTYLSTKAGNYGNKAKLAFQNIVIKTGALIYGLAL